MAEEQATEHHYDPLWDEGRGKKKGQKAMIAIIVSLIAP